LRWRRNLPRRNSRRARPGKTRFVFPNEFPARNDGRPIYRTGKVVRRLRFSRWVRPRRQVRQHCRWQSVDCGVGYAGHGRRFAKTHLRQVRNRFERQTPRRRLRRKTAHQQTPAAVVRVTSPDIRTNRKLTHSRAKRTWIRRSPLFLVGAVEDYAYLFERDQAAVDHFIEPWEDALDSFCVFYHLDYDREILREA
jgi:hypothetical protein